MSSKRLVLAALLTLLTTPAWAQNTTCANRPTGDSTNACANTRFVQSNGAAIVSDLLDWYVVGSTSYPTIASAIAAADANKGGTIFFPCGNYSLGSGAVGINLDDRDFPIRVTGNGAPFGGPANKCVVLNYSGVGTAISARSTRSIEIDHLQIYSFACPSKIIDLSQSTTGGNSEPPAVHDNTVGIICADATNVGIDLSDTQNAVVTRNSIFTNTGIGVRGVAPTRQFSVKATINENIFGSGNGVAISAPGQNWTISNNTVQGGTQLFIGAGPATTCTTAYVFGNWVGDYFTGGKTLITSNCTSLISIGNEYANGTGGTGINIQQANSTGTVTSIGDRHEGTTAVAIGTGNRLHFPDYALGSVGVAVTGTPAQTQVANGVLYSNGYGTPFSSTAAMTNGQLLIGQTGAAPAPATVSGDITITAGGVTAVGANKITNAMLRQSAALSVIGRSANSAGDVADISTTAGSGAILRETGNVLGFGALPVGAITNASITYAKIQDVFNLSVFGRSANSTGVGGNISATAGSGQILRESGSVLGFGSITTYANFPMGVGGGCGTMAQAATHYFGPNGCFGATEALAQSPVARAFTLSGFRAVASVAPAAGQTMTMTVRKNGAAGGTPGNVGCVITGPANSCNDPTNSLAFAAGDLINVQAVFSATTGSTSVVNTQSIAAYASP